MSIKYETENIKSIETEAENIKSIETETENIKSIKTESENVSHAHLITYAHLIWTACKVIYWHIFSDMADINTLLGNLLTKSCFRNS